MTSNPIANLTLKSVSRWLVMAGVLLFPLQARAELARICTREPGSRVTVRTGPGVDHPRGLTEVGSGGEAVFNTFEQANFTVAGGEEVSIFSRTEGTDNHVWYEVGSNQWVGWVRSDFVCQSLDD